MNFDLQPQHLRNKVVQLVPLHTSDFDQLFNVASDPLIWQQHPNPNRYQLQVFKTYFDSAMASKGAFKIINVFNNNVIGCTRFYDLDYLNKSIKIGYTFIARDHWGSNINQSIKKLMIDYALQQLDTIFFEVGSLNIRSQKAMLKIGAQKIDEKKITYFGEQPKLNFIYKIVQQQQ